MSDVAIQVEGLSKRYRIGLQEKHDSVGSALVDLLTRPAKNLRRLRRLSRFDDDDKQQEDIIWALKDISFEVNRGDVVGVIGPNGAGKTTLLRILSRITEPTGGRAKIYGKVSSLLEVGTGFHPELTGRDNVYLNGSLLGMSRREISGKFDDLVDFSGVAKFIDTPVKRYSSGMRVRLAFSVAAHLEPDILLVDEVLAVGDAAFQAKCLGKMEEVSSEGRTVLFVSHNMGSIGKLCPTSMLIHEGRLVFSGESHDAIQRYLTAVYDEGEARAASPRNEAKAMNIESIRILDHNDDPSVILDRIQPFRVEVKYQVREHINDAHVSMSLFTKDGVSRVCESRDDELSTGSVVERKPGTYSSVVEFPGGLLDVGAYYASGGLYSRRLGWLEQRLSPSFELIDYGEMGNHKTGHPHDSILAFPLKWSTDTIDHSQHPSTE